MSTLRTTAVDLYDVSAAEIVAIARSNSSTTITSTSFTFTNGWCTNFVWAVANAAGARYYSGGAKTGEVLDQGFVSDTALRTIPDSGIGSPYTGTATPDFASVGTGMNMWATQRFGSLDGTSLAGKLNAGDIVRMRDEGSGLPHSFVVVQKGSTAATTKVVGTWTPLSGGSLCYVQETTLQQILDNKALFNGSFGAVWISTLKTTTSTTGANGNDILRGTTLADTFTGGTGNDYIFGREGNDNLTGGAGKDYLAGGLDADKFIFLNKSESAVGSGRDVIRDFQPNTDKIDLHLIDANDVLPGIQHFTFLGKVAGSASLKMGAVGFYTGSVASSDGGTTHTGLILCGDTTGDGKADFEIAVDGRYMSLALLTATDLIFW